MRRQMSGRTPKSILIAPALVKVDHAEAFIVFSFFMPSEELDKTMSAFEILSH
jgi:hypothetical protein